MCGIVSTICIRESSDSTALRALKRLSYRGYDSFGYFNTNLARPLKYIGAISDSNFDGTLDPLSRITLAHTRWATHGEVSESNSHPHMSMNGDCVLVHNGVISNFDALRVELENKGYSFCGETDSEVVANLIEAELRTALAEPLTKDISHAPEKLIKKVCNRLEGEFALCIYMPLWRNSVFAICKNSPLVLGRSKEVMMLASDEIALRGFCDEYIQVPQNEVSSIHRGCMTLIALTPEPRDWEPLDDYEAVTLHEGGSFFFKEMQEIPEAIQRSLEADTTALAAPHLQDVVLTGCGSAYYASQIGLCFRKMNPDTLSRTLAFPADELPYMYALQPDDTLVCVSQSGETYDTIAPARGWGRVVSITNSQNSTLSRLSNAHVFQNIGEERCVLSTKSIVSQCIILHRAFLPGHMSVHRLPDIWRLCFNKKMLRRIERLARKYICSDIQNYFHVGRGIYSPVAHENALKLKEVSYVHAEGMSAGFFKHGTLSLIDERFVTFAHLPSASNTPELYALTKANISEIEARDGVVVTIGHDKSCDFELPDIAPSVNPLLHLGFGQYYAYYLAKHLGRPLDRPRHLAKSVTVR